MYNGGKKSVNVKIGNSCIIYTYFVYAIRTG